MLGWNTCPACADTTVVAATRTPGQPFGAAATLSPPEQAGLGPTLAIAPSGEAVAVWGQEIKRTHRVGLATYRFGG